MRSTRVLLNMFHLNDESVRRLKRAVVILLGGREVQQDVYKRQVLTGGMEGAASQVGGMGRRA